MRKGSQSDDGDSNSSVSKKHDLHSSMGTDESRICLFVVSLGFLTKIADSLYLPAKKLGLREITFQTYCTVSPNHDPIDYERTLSSHRKSKID